MLTPYFETIEKAEENFKVCMEREKRLRYKIEPAFPADVDAQVCYDPIGKSCIRAFIYLKQDVSKEDTEKCRHFLVALFGKAKRDFREQEGKFMWKGEGEFSDGKETYRELVLIENANPGECKIKAVQKTVTVYETDCKPEG